MNKMMSDMAALSKSRGQRLSKHHKGFVSPSFFAAKA